MTAETQHPREIRAAIRTGNVGFVRGGFQNRHQFPLQGTMIALGALAQLLGKRFRYVLDRQVE